MRPNSLIARLYLTRGARLWVAARLLCAMGLAMGNEDPIHLTFMGRVIVIAMSIALGTADMERRHERALLENLAVTRAMRVAFFAVPALLGEAGVYFATRIAG